MVLLEVCTDSVSGVQTSACAGASRIELCSALSLGGLTPSYGLIAGAVAAAPLHVPVHILIRPRSGDFVFSEDEICVMEEDIRQAGRLGAAGVVLGALLPDGTINEATTLRLINATHSEGCSLDVTFHRAFDMCQDLPSALEQLIMLGIPRVLTSGGYPTAAEGAAVIRGLVHQSQGRIVVMAGAGVNEHCVAALVAGSGVQEVHGSARRSKQSSMAYRRPGMSLSSSCEDEYAPLCTDAACIKAILAAVNGVVGPSS